MRVCTRISFSNKNNFPIFKKIKKNILGNDCFSRNICSTHAHLLTAAVLTASAAVLMVVVVVLGVGGIEACG